MKNKFFSLYNFFLVAFKSIYSKYTIITVKLVELITFKI